MTGYNIYLNQDEIGDDGVTVLGCFDPLFLGLSYQSHGEALKAVRLLEETGLYSKGSIEISAASVYRSIAE